MRDLISLALFAFFAIFAFVVAASAYAAPYNYGQ